MSSSHPSARPHWTPAGTLLLGIADDALPLPEPSLRLDGIEFTRKRELHATIVGHALGSRLRRANAGDAGMRAAVDAAIAARDWRWRRCREWALLERHEGDRCRHSVIERIDLPAMADFHRRIGELLGDVLQVPPAHVTLYTAGGPKGIGVPDEATLARLRVRTLDAAELQGVVR
jgi:hypothetical protein